MPATQALIPFYLDRSTHRLRAEILALLGGTLYLALLAQIAIPLPFTPVPITGQTFGVATLALLWGRRRAMATFFLYVTEGALGLPVFAQLSAAPELGATTGYLVGMAIACYVVGGRSDRGQARTFRGAFLSAVLGSVCVFAAGIVGLAFYLPSQNLIVAGLLPFLPGDLVKNILAAQFASRLSARAR